MRRLILFLMMLLVLTGCAKTKTSTEKTIPETAVPATEAVQETETIPEITEEATEAVTVPLEKEQAPLILAQREIWEQEDFSAYEPWWYSFTDLDHNGRMEVFAAITQGTGIFTTGKLYELSEDGILTEYSLQEFLPEMIRNRVTCYEDSNGQYHYAFDDTIRNGAADNSLSLDWLTFHDGKLDVDTLAWQRNYSPAAFGDMETIFGNEDGEISELDFWNAYSEAGAGMNRRTVMLEWRRFEEIQDDFDIVNIYRMFSGTTGFLRQEKIEQPFFVEGEQENVPMSLFVTGDYSIYIPDEGWCYALGEDHGLPADHWVSEVNEDVWMHIIYLKDSNLRDARLWLMEHEPDFQSDNLISMTRTAAAGYLEGENVDGSEWKTAHFYPVNNDVFIVLCSYPQEAAEGFGSRLDTISRTFEAF